MHLEGKIIGLLQLHARATAKLGQCPAIKPGTIGLCVEQCSSDEDCNGNLKCCSNGCGHTCQEPGKTDLT